MTHDLDAAPLGALDALLETERTALLAGQLDQLSDLLPQKEVLIDELNQGVNVEPSQLRVIGQKVERNQALLDGALQGIRAASNRITTFHRVSTTLETYDAAGARKSVGVADKYTVEKRA